MYADVVVALNTPMVFSYNVPSLLEKELEVGVRVSVPFGKSRIYSAVVIAIHSGNSKDELKDIINIIEREITSPKQLQFWNWISSYYMVALGEVALSFLPPSLKQTEKTNATLSLTGLQSLQRVVKTQFISLSENYQSLTNFEAEVERLKGSRAKQMSLITFASLALEKKIEIDSYEIERKKLIEAGCSSGAIAQLVKLGVFSTSSRKIGVENRDVTTEYQAKNLEASPELLAILNDIETSLENHQTTLLHHNNPSFKNQIIVYYLAKLLAEGRGEILYILPDKQSAKEAYKTLKEHFGNIVINNLGDKSSLKRHEDYLRVARNNSTLLVVASRGGVGLPFKNLRGVVVDSENDSSYFGSEYELHYNGRDSAIYLAFIHGCKTLLCSEFPSFETFNNCQKGKFGYTSCLEEKLAKIALIDRSTIGNREELETKDGIPQKRYISKLIINEIAKRLEKKEVSFIYQNRKGFSTIVRCKECGYIVMCKNCNVPLTYHKGGDTMRCRYCSSAYSRIEKCPECNSYNIHPQGIGTENVEERLQELFPQAKIARVDGDKASSGGALAKNANLIALGEIDIIVGTQMFTKLPSINNLTLIGIVNGDNIFSFPDYRSSEKGFSALSTLYNRLANTNKSIMIVQMSENRDITSKILANNYLNIYNSEIDNRKKFGYPPYCKIILFTLRHRSATQLDLGAQRVYDKLKGYFGGEVIGPFTPQIDKIRREYIVQIMVKVNSMQKLSKAKEVAIYVKKSVEKVIKTDIVTY